MTSTLRWGVVSTIKAPLADILAFSAWHLDQGAARISIYLDAPDPAIARALADHPGLRVVTCDDAYWATHPRRPNAHQPRQTRNASHAYARSDDLDWLVHVDVDEFLRPRQGRISDHLAAVPETTRVARARPIEALQPETDSPLVPFKAFHPDHRKRQRAAEAVFPTWGRYLSGGFLSHVAGKIFVRTGLGPIEFRIHNAFLRGDRIKDDHPLDAVELCHMHAKSWEVFRDHLGFRLDRGSYRSDLKSQVRGQADRINLHTLFSLILEEDGEEGLKAFYREVCLATPELRAALKAEGLFREYDFGLPSLISKHFPGLAP